MATRAQRPSPTEFRELLVYWIAVLVGIFWVAQADAATWTTFRAPAGFSIEVPETPVESATTHASLFGEISSRHYEAREGKVHYSANISVLPRWIARVAGPDRLLGEAVEAFLSDAGARAEAVDEVECAGGVAWGLSYRTPMRGATPARSGRANFILIGRALYVFDASFPNSLEPALAERFLAGVRFQ